MTLITSHSNELREALRSIDAGLGFDSRPELASVVHWHGAAHQPIHRWYRYREAYAPDLIEALSLGQRILDPFCGTGSIMVGAAEGSRVSVGVDLNPLAVYVAQAKLTPLTPTQLQVAMHFAVNCRLYVTEACTMDPPHLKIADKVFEPLILSAILRLRSAIEAFASQDPPLRRFLMVAWLAILPEVGSYFTEGNGIKYRNKKRLKTGYIRREEGSWQQERFGKNQEEFVYQSFERQLRMMLEDTPRWTKGCWGKQRVIEGSALDLPALLGNTCFDSIIFSPPYANRFDYFEALKVELWFGGFVKTYRDLTDLRKRSLRSHLAADLSRPARLVPDLERLIALMDRDSSSWRMRVPSALRGYFDDMALVLAHCRRFLAPGGRCHVVVGNSAYAGVIVPTDTLLARLGLDAGFASARLEVVRHLTVAPQQRTELNGFADFMRESVVVLQ